MSFSYYSKHLNTIDPHTFIFDTCFSSLISASHPEGLGIAIVGDDIYGQRDKRLCLHAGFLQIDHPKTGKRITFTAPIPF